MKVSMEWLNELVDVKESAEILAETLTRGGIEVGSVNKLGTGLEQVIIGQIISLTRHPNAEKLWICVVDVGAQNLAIVTGAQNLLVGDKVPVAVVGAQLPNGVEIKLSKLRGVESQGMLCSTKELLLEASMCLPRSNEGIMILASEAPVGIKVSAFLGLDDSVLDLEIYPNRPDCLAMVNVAREVASLTGWDLSLTEQQELTAKLDLPTVQDFEIKIEEPDLCWQYAGLLVEDVRVAASPEWMQHRLRSAGVRPINNIVDITNYCMLEFGQPLHAFDRDKVTGNIHVRRAKPKENLVTLDNIDRQLDSQMLVIADDHKALAIAGVMGGLESEVTPETKRLIIESAHFAGVSVRRTSRRLGLRSEASNRFEKGTNPYAGLPVLARVSELLEQLGVGRSVGLAIHTSHLPELRTITLSVRHTEAVLGVEVSSAEIAQVFDRLRFPYRYEGDRFEVDIPSYRGTDLQIEEDLIEEVARLVGYDRIPTTLPQGAQTQGARSSEQEFRRRLRKTLLRVGMDEVITYSFTNPDIDEKWGNRAQAISILNPLREETGGMRTSIMPGLLGVASRNLARRNMDLSIFEIGNVYLATDQSMGSLPDEPLRVAGLAAGKSRRHWLGQPIKYDFYYLKGILEEVAREFRVTLSYQAPLGSALLHPGRSAEVYLGQTRIGFLGELHPSLEKEWNLERAVVFELDLTYLVEQAQELVRVQSIPRFPAVQRDLAVVVSKEIAASAVTARIRELGGTLLQSVEIFDVYTGKPIPEDRKSLAFNLRYQALDRTLTDEEVNQINSGILEGIQQEFAAEWRK